MSKTIRGRLHRDRIFRRCRPFERAVGQRRLRHSELGLHRRFLRASDARCECDPGHKLATECFGSGKPDTSLLELWRFALRTSSSATSVWPATSAAISASGIVLAQTGSKSGSSCIWPPLAAQPSASCPLELTCPALAPAARSAATTLAFPPAAPQSNGVSPAASCCSSGAPISSRSWMHSSLAADAAHSSGERQLPSVIVSASSVPTLTRRSSPPARMGVCIGLCAGPSCTWSWSHRSKTRRVAACPPLHAAWTAVPSPPHERAG
eukprot:scaffold182964_cov30-Tisochrysis_lutea.AAC.2